MRRLEAAHPTDALRVNTLLGELQGFAAALVQLGEFTPDVARSTVEQLRSTLTRREGLAATSEAAAEMRVRAARTRDPNLLAELPLPALRQVWAPARPDQHPGLVSVEVWSSHVVVRSFSSQRGVKPDPPGWSVFDDLGTAYAAGAVYTRGSSPMVGHYEFAPGPPAAARRLTIRGPGSQRLIVSLHRLADP